LIEHNNDAKDVNGLLFAGYLIILATHESCGQFKQCYNDVNICLWTEGAEETISKALPTCKPPNSILPRITNSDIQDKLAEFRSADKRQGSQLLNNNGFWIDVYVTTGPINPFHWIDGSSLTGHFIDEFAGIVEL